MEENYEQIIEELKHIPIIDMIYGNGYFEHIYANNYMICVSATSKYRRGRGEYLYKIDPITKKQTLIEFIPEETNNLKMNKYVYTLPYYLD